MKRAGLFALLIIVVLAISALGSALFVVRETEQVVITQFGKPVGDPIREPGINLKVPFIQKANYFDKRFLEWDGDANQLPTKDKRFLWVDTYARWRIIDPLLFFQRLRDERGAQSRLDDILDGQTRNAVANHELAEIVRATDRELQFGDLVEDAMKAEAQVEVEFGRNYITREIIETASPSLEQLGIELLDLRLKRVNYVEEVRNKIFDRMRSERKRIAEKFRSEGQGEAAQIRGQRERDLRKIRSEAFRKAEEIKGDADAEATAIYASAYDQGPQSREFYEFLKTMETYSEVLGGDDWLVLSTEGDFFRFLESASGDK
ncbi:MAG: protease modulator HflC [Nitrospirota bacterium]|jgi:membrane protease subunit HflC